MPDNVLKCHKGRDPIVNPDAENYQMKVFCRVYGQYINPYGYTCAICAQGGWPPQEEIKTIIKSFLSAGDFSHDKLSLFENDLINMVKRGQITKKAMIDALIDSKYDDSIREFLKNNKEKEEEEHGSDQPSGSNISD
jgi:hypothetical protein